MDEDLKIILTSELEADEQASANRIAAQLPNISKLVNSKSSIKVGVELDSRNTGTQMQKISTQLQGAASRVNLGLKFDFGEDKVRAMADALRNLNIPQSMIQKFIDNIYEANAGVRSISTSFDDVRNVVTATISGLDRAGNVISQIQSAKIDDDGSATLLRNVTAITTNYEELARAEQRAAEAAKRAAEENTADLTRWAQQLESIRNKWDGVNPSVKQDANVSALRDEFDKVADAISKLDENSGRWGKDVRADVEAQIKSLRELADAYRNLEKAPTELRAKDVSVIKEEQMKRLDTFETKLSTSGVLTEELSGKVASLREQLNGVSDSKGITAFMDKFGVLKAEAESLRATLAQTRISEELEKNAQRVLDTMDVTGLRVDELKQKFALLGAPAENLKKPFDDIRERLIQIDELTREVENASSAEARVKAYQRLDTAIDDCNQALTLMNKLQTGDVRDVRFTQSLEKAKADLDTIRRTWSAFQYDAGLNNQFKQLETSLRNVNSQMDLKKWSAQFGAFKSEVKAAGKNTQSFFDIIKNNVNKVGQWALATGSLYNVLRKLKEGVEIVISLDTAMIDLKKTTDATDAQYQAFYKTANQTAKELNVTTEAIISQTAEWSRLGYTLEEAAELAKNSAIFAAVSPEMTTEEATDGLVSILKAFDEIDENDALDGIISKINILGNRLAVTNKDLVEVMTRSSAAMRAANTSFEESLAIATAAVEVTRDSQSVGNALKTVSMRIRGLDEETEEYSEDIAVLKGQIADLTKVASNNFTGVSLFEPGDPDTYRSIYDILADIADIWDELTDKNQAQLLEVMFGKRQGQIGSAILSNFKSAKKAMDEMANSAGSAMQEFAMVQDTVQYKFNQFKETWTGVAINLFDTDQMKFVVDVFNSISSAIEWTTDKLGLFGTTALGVFGAQLIKSVGRPEKTGLALISISAVTVPTYAPVVTRSELAA